MSDPTPPTERFDVIPDAGDGEPSIVMRDAPTSLREAALVAYNETANADGAEGWHGRAIDAVLAVVLERVTTTIKAQRVARPHVSAAPSQKAAWDLADKPLRQLLAAVSALGDAR